MREIKFRGKTKEGKWVYGNIAKVFNSYYIQYSETYGEVLNLQIDEGSEIDFALGRFYKVLNETVGQLLFTNPYSESFYDGDIVDVGQTINGCSQFVLKQGVYGIDVWYRDRTCLKYEYNVVEFLNMLMFNEFREVKVIGNIHDKK